MNEMKNIALRMALSTSYCHFFGVSEKQNIKSYFFGTLNKRLDAQVTFSYVESTFARTQKHTVRSVNII